jgi:hypothetical protein
MSSRLTEDLRSLQDARLHLGADASLLDALKQEHGVALPDQHADVLRESNGIEVYAGYVRLFGVRTADSIDAIAWNEPDCWKFAWGDRCSGYWCFAETGWGDQYAYALEELQAGGAAPVYFLDALSMTPQVVASSFAEFWEKEFVRSAKAPYDSMMKKAREKLGPLALTSHVIYVPSILLGGAEDISHVQTMNARAAMICNGDIASQVDAGPAAGAVKAIEPYQDDQGRARLRLVWETGSRKASA